MTPNPGSKKAIKAGCTFPILDNHHGHGIPWPSWDDEGNSTTITVWWKRQNCPLHGWANVTALEVCEPMEQWQASHD